MSRDEFPVKVRKAAYERSGGKCEECGQPFGKHPKTWPEYDHILPDFLDGKNDLENCKVLCRACHQAKTRQDMKPIAKVRREDRKRKRLERQKQKISYRRFNGDPVFK